MKVKNVQIICLYWNTPNQQSEPATDFMYKRSAAKGKISF